MTRDTRRITLITFGPGASYRDWNTSLTGPNRIITLKAMTVLRYALQSAIELEEDVERVVLDGASSAGEFLDLLATLPAEFTGDVMLIAAGGSGYLSATGRGGSGRLLYALSNRDVQFYLETHGLLAEEEVALSA